MNEISVGCEKRTVENLASRIILEKSGLVKWVGFFKNPPTHGFFGWVLTGFNGFNWVLMGSSLTVKLSQNMRKKPKFILPYL
jgi:hypothetical protein